MRACPACHRHAFLDEAHCPFCRATFGGTATAAVAFGLAAALGACGPRIDVVVDSDGAEGSTGADGPLTTSNIPVTSASGPMTSTSTTSPPVTTTPPGTTTLPTDGSTSTDTLPTDFIENPDGGSVYGVPCSVLIQDCLEGDKCMPWANDGGDVWNATRCSPVAEDPWQVGDPCTVEGSPVSGVDDCDLGSMCFHVDPDTAEGVCVAMCEDAVPVPVCADESRVCSHTHYGSVALCLLPCDPLGQDCPDGLSCQANDTEFVCVRPGEGSVGDACDLFVDCEFGLSCVVDAAGGCDEGCCTEACDPASPACSIGAQECSPFDDAGLCVLPE